MKILFYKGTKKENEKAHLWDRAICFITRSRFSHLELSLSDNGNLHHCWSSSGRDHGIRQKWIDVSSGHWIVFQITGDPVTIAEMEDQAEAWFLSKEGCSYDWLGLLGTILPFKMKTGDKWFCSEAVGESLGMTESAKLTPEDIYQTVSTNPK